MKETTKKKNRFFTFLRSLCSSQSSKDFDNQKNQKKSKLKVNKIPRLTFQLDRVLVKVSRKNIAEQQFMQNDVLTYHLEKYLSLRFKQCDIAIFSGEFSNFLIQKIPFCLELKSSKQELYDSENNYLLTNCITKFKLKTKSIDLIVHQLYFGQGEKNYVKDHNNSSQTQNSNKFTEINQNIDHIEQILKIYQKKVKNFAFICHKDLKLEDVHDLFLVFKENYIFEFQKVKKIQKTVCNIIYVSTETKFLRIDDSSLSQFIITEFDKFKAFQQNRQNCSNKLVGTQIQKKQHLKKDEEICSMKEGIRKQGFYNLIGKMFERNLHLKITQVLASILQFSDKKSDKIDWFLDLMYEQSPNSRDLIDSYRITPKQQNEQQVIKTYSELTPMFVQKFKDSNNFSKATAIFQTQNSPNDQFFLCYSPKKKVSEDFT